MENNNTFRAHLFVDRMAAKFLVNFWSKRTAAEIAAAFDQNAVAEICLAYVNLRDNTFIHRFEYDNLNLLQLYYYAYGSHQKNPSRDNGRKISSRNI